jgi:DNA-binding MarR family transcriptional regulator
MLRGKVSPTEMDFILFLYGGNRSCQDLCDHMNMSSATVHMNMKRMADKGLVGNATDGIYKAAMYHLTDAGRAVADEVKVYLV